MVKTRPVIIVSPNHLPRPGLYTVVPMSTTEPDPVQPYHYCFPKNPMPQKDGVAWAKCDMVVTVSVDRLDRLKIARGTYTIRFVTKEELAAIRDCMKHALGIV
jgi:uncharacterized protein YifN (PemK superfamily)